MGRGSCGLQGGRPWPRLAVCSLPPAQPWKALCCLSAFVPTSAELGFREWVLGVHVEPLPSQAALGTMPRAPVLCQGPSERGGELESLEPRSRWGRGGG